MPFFLLIVGVVFLVSAAKGTQQNLFSLLKGDFSGPDNYFYWLVSILVVGAFGYIPKFKPVSDMFLVLIVLSLVLTRGKAGLFQKASAVLNSTASTAPTTSQINTGLAATGATSSLAATQTSLQGMVNQLTGVGNTPAQQTQTQNFALATSPAPSSNIYGPISGLIQ